MGFFSEEDLNNRNTFTSLEDGNLFWIKANRKGTHQVPLSLLTEEQIDKLTQYLKTNELNYNEYSNSTNSRLVWEYWWGTRPEIIVDCFNLTREQKQKLSPKKKSTKSKNDNRIKFEINEIKKFQKAFKAAKISWKGAYKKLLDLKGKPWSTKSWKTKRESLIKESCEDCNSSSRKMVLQHTKQPRKPKTILKQYKSQYRNSFEEWLKSNPVSINTSPYPKETPACPKCNSQTIRYRKTKKSWVCRSTIKGITCGYVFEEPVYQVARKTINSLEEKVLKEKFEAFLELKGLDTKLINECFADLIEYL